jgi:hypothetical protein
MLPMVFLSRGVSFAATSFFSDGAAPAADWFGHFAIPVFSIER